VEVEALVLGTSEGIATYSGRHRHAHAMARVEEAPPV